MNAYEQMKNSFLAELNRLIPDITGMTTQMICNALDKAAYPFEITAKETAIAVREEIIPEIVKVYIAVKKTEGLSNDTLENYARILKQFFLWVKKQPDAITANDIRMFLYNYQQYRHVSNITLEKYREMICWFFTWAYREEYIQRDPSRSVKSIKVEVKERQALTPLELEHLRLACKTAREKAMLEFMYSTGCRVSELCVVKMSDVDFKENTVHLYGKGRKHRTSFINARCEVALDEYLKHRKGTSEYLFVSDRCPHDGLTKAAVEKIVRQFSERSGLKKHITPHILRHTTATQAVNNGMAIEDVSKLLGHANVTTTMIYAKVSQSKVHAEHQRCVI
jgi:integrase/recombinase XerD